MKCALGVQHGYALIKASCLTNLSKMFASIYFHANNPQWLCRVCLNQAWGREIHIDYFWCCWFFLTLWTRGSVAEEYLIPPDNLEGSDDRPSLLRVWQEHTIKAAVSLCRKRYCFREREPTTTTTTNKITKKNIHTPWEIRMYFFFFPHFSLLCLRDSSTCLQVLISFPEDKLHFYTFQWTGWK